MARVAGPRRVGTGPAGKASIGVVDSTEVMSCVSSSSAARIKT
jgi:hypothetical protein